MIYTAIAPEAALQSTVGETLTGLIYSAFHPPVRRLALVAAGISKTVPRPRSVGACPAPSASASIDR